jgi:hypothetical protein
LENEINSRNARSATAAPASDLVVHTRARQLLEWLLPQLARVPREHRHTLGAHLAELTMRVLDALVAARHLRGDHREAALLEADIALDQLRQYLDLGWRWRWLSDGQYRHVSGLTAELGRLIGGWRRSARAARQGAAPG